MGWEWEVGGVGRGNTGLSRRKMRPRGVDSGHRWPYTSCCEDFGFSSKMGANERYEERAAPAHILTG